MIFLPSTITHDPPLLYNLNIDPSEKYDIAEDNPEILTGIKKVMEDHLAFYPLPDIASRTAKPYYLSG